MLSFFANAPPAEVAIDDSILAILWERNIIYYTGGEKKIFIINGANPPTTFGVFRAPTMLYALRLTVEPPSGVRA